MESLNNQTLKADKIVCTLSREDFDEVPEELNREDIEIQWIDNNIKVWKKLAVVFDLYPTAEIINVDDDVYYPPTFIEILHNKYIETKQPVTVGLDYTGYGTLTTSAMFRGYRPNQVIIDNVVAADLWYAFILHRNGYNFTKAPEAFETREMIGSPCPYTTPENIKLEQENRFIRNFYL